MTVPAPDHDRSFIAEALPAFIDEAREQITTIEQLLLALEDAPDDRDLIDALFRSVHTVKGSAGIFGLDHVVAFTHHVETLLDQLRDGQLPFDSALGTLLLRCNDEIRSLVDVASDSGGHADDGRADERSALVVQLQAASRLAGGTASAPDPAAAARPPELLPPGGQAPRRWHLTAEFGRETFRNGMDPLAILNYLDRLGRVDRVACDLDAVPALEDLDPEACHLTFELALDTEASRDEIEGAFSFVRDDCRLHLLEPGATPQDVVRLIESMPDNPRIGDILVAVGAITRAQLRQALDVQGAVERDGQSPPRLGELLQATSGVSPEVVAAALDKQRKGRDGGGTPAAAEDQRFIRVQADRLDAVINLLGELVIAAAGASMLATQARQRTLIKANQQVGRLIEEIRNSTLQLRMVPIGETFSRFRRVVRDTAADLGKDVALELHGGETELDKSVVERIADPLMHLVRNALDHGLEAPEARIAAGKPAQGRLRLSACHDAGHIVIRIEDDGRGIDRGRVLQRARERGLVPADATPTDAEIVGLIFEPGFSTAETVTKLSGRGVGMDVVRRNIEALRGSIALSGEQGQGCCVEIRLPLTLAIIDGFLVGVGSSRFIFPLDAVVEVIENRPGLSEPDEGGRTVLELRRQVLPVLCLRRLYGMPGTAPERRSVVVIQAGPQRYGVVVDQLLGQHQTVIKPLARLFRSLRGMSGSSILGNGEVALIFDAAALGQLAARPRGDRPHPSRPTGPSGHPLPITPEGQHS